jgi:hypothetical protein
MKGSNYIILDAARMDGLIYMAQDMNEKFQCLYQGDSELSLGSIAPWLFDLRTGRSFRDWLQENGSNNSWGVIVQTDSDQETVHKHLRKFLIVKTEDARELIFRFYDPRVLRVFLPTCDAKQLEEFFGPIGAYVMEDEDGNMLEFKFQKGELVKTDLNCDFKAYLLGDEEDIPEVAPLAAEQDKPDESEAPSRHWEF